MTMPQGVEGIMGWDWVQHFASARAEFDLLDPNASVLRVDELPVGAPLAACSFQTQLIAAGRLPCLSVTMYGVSVSTTIGVIDSGSPLTIVSPAFADTAALFDIKPRQASQHR